ncbi:hypothetical protein DPEC_G00263570 [Dallia pectoralis]|uniref:Uncharacterized protein n=1 Tax=Dallia pectoralis TaxID=75939 RepID=A0ACC2FS86_DALPE|nr:hypothetical protein DPEC_G00263570 [Dallia pectoralis]
MTHRVTVRLGSSPGSGVSESSSLLQVTLFRTTADPWALVRSSVQLQPLVTSPGQAAGVSRDPEPDSRTSSSISSNTRPGSGVPTPGTVMVLIGLPSAVPLSSHVSTRPDELE